MSDDEKLDLESIKAGVAPPTETVTKRSDEEGRFYARARDKPTPTELHHAAVDRHLATIDKQCAKLEQELQARETQVRSLQREIDWLKPENARLAESYKNVVYNNVISSACIAIGGITASAASATAYVVPVTCVGVSVFGVAIVAQIVQLIRAAYFAGPRPAPAVEDGGVKNAPIALESQQAPARRPG
jgi:uncharacterized protein (DUF3084 family)